MLLVVWGSRLFISALLSFYHYAHPLSVSVRKTKEKRKRKKKRQTPKKQQLYEMVYSTCGHEAGVGVKTNGRSGRRSAEQTEHALPFTSVARTPRSIPRHQPARMETGGTRDGTKPRGSRGKNPRGHGHGDAVPRPHPTIPFSRALLI